MLHPFISVANILDAFQERTRGRYTRWKSTVPSMNSLETRLGKHWCIWNSEGTRKVDNFPAPSEISKGRAFHIYEFQRWGVWKCAMGQILISGWNRQVSDPISDRGEGNDCECERSMFRTLLLKHFRITRCKFNSEFSSFKYQLRRIYRVSVLNLIRL